MSGSKTSEISGIEETSEQPQQNEKAKHQSVNIVTEIEEAPVEDSAPAENNSTGEVLSRKGPSSSSKSPFTKYPEIMDAVGEGETTKMADIIMKYMSEFEGTSHTEERIQNAWKIIDYCLQDSRAKDELYKQLMSQSRERENEDTKYNLWELWLIIVTSFKPSKKRIRAVTDYIFWVSKELAVNEELEDLVKRVWSTFKRSTKIKQRIKPLTVADIEVLLGIATFQTTISFIDGSTESLEYDPTVTVADVVETISERINLEHFSTFTLFQVVTNSSEEDSWEVDKVDMILLDQDQYITDIDPNSLSSNLVFKKRVFCEQDAYIDDPVFINLCYLQARYEFLEGKYPVAQDDGAQLCALLIHATNGPGLERKDVEFSDQISKCTPKTRIIDWKGEKWRKNVYMRYENFSELIQQETKSHFVIMIYCLPYRDSVEFEVETVGDPIGLFPYKLILGINGHGVHFFRPVPKEYLHSVELQDILQFYSSTSTVSLQMRMSGVIHVFEFETIQEEEICQALQNHVSDIAMNKMQKSLISAHAKTGLPKEEPHEFKDSMVPKAVLEMASWGQTWFLTEEFSVISGYNENLGALQLCAGVFSRPISSEPELSKKMEQITKLKAQLQHVTNVYRLTSNELQELQEYLTKVEQIKQYKESNHKVELERRKILEKNRRIIEELHKRVKKEQEERKKNHNEIQDLQGKIRVYCRVRPFLQSDGSEKQMNALSIPNDTTITHKSTFPWAVPRDEDEKYLFHKVFASEAQQEEVFESVKYMVQSVVDGYNVCVIAYGQTGSGKTHTIMGSEENPGIARRVVHELFRVVERERESENLYFEIQCSLLELYKNKFKDLLRPNEKVKVEVKQGLGGTVVCGAEKRNIASEQQLQDILEEGHKRRHTGSTKMNKVSSRSHMIISLVIKTTNLQTQRSCIGKINFVDLAGMERLKKSEAFGEQREEARANNLSLYALQNVIKYLSEGHPSPPYRSSKLTHLLKEFIGGDSKTAMFVNVSPCLSDLKETKFALCYAQEMSVIKNDGTRGLMDEEASRLREHKFEWEKRTDIFSSYEQFL